MNKFEEAKLHADMCTVESYNILIDFITSCEETEKEKHIIEADRDSIHGHYKLLRQQYDVIKNELEKCNISEKLFKRFLSRFESIYHMQDT